MANTPAVSISKLANLAAVLALAAAAFGNTVFGVSGLELVASGLALHVGGDVLESVLN